MIEQPLGTDKLSQGRVPLRHLWPMLLAPVALTGMCLALAHWRGSEPDAVERLLFGLCGFVDLMFLLVLPLMWWHWHDEQILDDEGLTQVTRRGRTTMRWDAIDDLSHPMYFNRMSTLLLSAGKQKRLLALYGLVIQPGAAERLQLRLERAKQAKLRRMAEGEVRLGQRGMAARMLIAVAVMFAVIGWMFSQMPPSDFAPPTWMLAFFAVPMLGSMVPMTVSLRRAAGPESLLLGWRRVPLGAVESIHIVRIGATEAWHLRGPGVRAKLSGGVDFPLLCEHLIRQCPRATYSYDVRSPRGPVEGTFLPLPPGATPELMVAADEATAERAVKRTHRHRWVLRLAAHLAVVAAVPLWFTARQVHRQYTMERQSATVTGHVVAHNQCWHAEYTVDGQTYEDHVWRRAEASPTVQAGDEVILHYLPSDPDEAWTGDAPPVWKPPIWFVLGPLALVASLVLLGVWMIRRERLGLAPQPRAAGF